MSILRSCMLSRLEQRMFALLITPPCVYSHGAMARALWGKRATASNHNQSIYSIKRKLNKKLQYLQVHSFPWRLELKNDSISGTYRGTFRPGGADCAGAIGEDRGVPRPSAQVLPRQDRPTHCET